MQAQQFPFVPNYGQYYWPPPVPPPVPVPAPPPQVEYLRMGPKLARTKVHIRRERDERYVMGLRMGHEVAAGTRIDNLGAMIAPFSSRGKRRFWLGFAMGLHRQGKSVRRTKRRDAKNLVL